MYEMLQHDILAILHSVTTLRDTQPRGDDLRTLDERLQMQGRIRYR
jgi:hypothetical protein